MESKDGGFVDHAALCKALEGEGARVIDDVGRAFQNEVGGEFAGAGACMTPCPLKPLAKKSRARPVRSQ